MHREMAKSFEQTSVSPLGYLHYQKTLGPLAVPSVFAPLRPLLGRKGEARGREVRLDTD